MIRAKNIITNHILTNSDMKGNREVIILNAGDDEEGLSSFTEYEFVEYYLGDIFRGSMKIPKKLTINGVRFPHDGIIITNRLLQLNASMKVIPYQSGRGVPIHVTDRLIVNTDIPFDSMPSMGAIQGNNDMCIGISLANNAVLTDGIETLPVGAVTNIATLYKSDGTPVIPLFRDERVITGTKVYATCLGMNMLTIPNTQSPYPLVSYSDANGIIQWNYETKLMEPLGTQMDGRRLNPFWDYFDTTFGNNGYTSTPEEHGTLIIQASTIGLGSGRKPLLGPPKYYVNSQAGFNGNSWERWSKILEIPHNPGRALSVGYTLDGIDGTGSWSYTGDLDESGQTMVTGGLGYTTGIYATKTNGTGTGFLIEVLAVDAAGRITSQQTERAGTGYEIGDIIYVVDNTINWAEHTVTWKRSTAVLFFNANPNKTLITGHPYELGYFDESYNVSMNNLLLTATFVEDQFIYHMKPTLLDSVAVFEIDDYSRYPLGSRIGLVANNIHRDNWAVLEVASNDGSTTITFNILKAGALAGYRAGSYVYATELLERESPRMRVELNDNSPFPTSVSFITYPNTWHLEDDYFIVKQCNSGMNCIFQLQYPTIGLCKPIIGTDFVYDRDLINDVRHYEGSVTVIRDMDIGEVNSLGQPSTLFYDHNTQIANPLVDPAVYTQPAQPYIFDPPQGTIDTYIPNTHVQRYLGYVEDPRLYFTDRGLGYTLGSASMVGGGTGGEIYITKVSDTGAILQYKFKTTNNSYTVGDSITIGGGTSTASAIIRNPRTREIQSIWNDNQPVYGIANEHLVANLLWDVEILSGGTGYTTTTYAVTSDMPNLQNVRIKVLTVSGGAVVEAEVDKSGDPSLEAQTGYCCTLTGGGSDAIIRLAKPLRARVPTLVPLRATDGLAREAENLSTQLILWVETVAGSIAFSQYDGVYGEMYRKNNLSRYSDTDVVRIQQDDTGNRSASYDITDVNAGRSRLQLSPNNAGGSGYTTPAEAFVSCNHEDRSTFDVVDGYITIDSLNAFDRWGDVLVLDNCCFQLTAERLVPPTHMEEENFREPTLSEWNTYDSVLDSAVNLLDNSVRIKFQREHPQYYDASYYFYGDPDNKDPNSVGWSRLP